MYTKIGPSGSGRSTDHWQGSRVNNEIYMSIHETDSTEGRVCPRTEYRLHTFFRVQWFRILKFRLSNFCFNYTFLQYLCLEFHFNFHLLSNILQIISELEKVFFCSVVINSYSPIKLTNFAHFCHLDGKLPDLEK